MDLVAENKQKRKFRKSATFRESAKFAGPSSQAVLDPGPHSLGLLVKDVVMVVPPTPHGGPEGQESEGSKGVRHLPEHSTVVMQSV